MNINSMKLQRISLCQPTSVVSMINPSLDCEVEITIISQNCIEKRCKQINHLFYPEHYNGMYEIKLIMCIVICIIDIFHPSSRSFPSSFSGVFNLLLNAKFH